MIYDLESLYQKLFPKALSISAKSLSGYTNIERASEIAHDITVDFLFFSSSFREIYDPTVGNLLPFFSSYVKKKLRKVWWNFNCEIAVANVDDEWVKRSVFFVPGFEQKTEMKDYVYRVFRKVNGKTCLGVSVGDVFKAGLVEIMDSGRISVRGVCESLGLKNRKGVKRSLRLIQYYLGSEEGGRYEPDFYVC